MLKVLSVLSIIIIFLFYMIYNTNPSVLKIFSTQKLFIPGTWGTINVVQEEPIGNIRKMFQPQLVWQILEQLCGFVTGALVCVLIGRTYSNLHLTSIENLLTESTQKLGELQLQIVDLKTRICSQDTVRCASCLQTSILAEESKSVLIQEDASEDKYSKEENQNDKFEKLMHRIVETIKKADIDKSTFESILEKIINLLERLTETKVTVKNLDSGSLSEGAETREYCKKQSFEIENETDEVEEIYEVTNRDKDQKSITNTPDDVEVLHYLHYNVSKNISHELQLSETSENSSNSASVVGAGECEETFHAKIVPVSQIPKFNELRKGQNPRVKTPKELDEKCVPFVSSRNIDQVVGERTQITPRIISSPMERPASRGGRRTHRF